MANELQRDVLLHARHLFLLTVEAESFKDTVSCLVGDGAKSRLRAKAVANPDTISARWTETARVNAKARCAQDDVLNVSLVESIIQIEGDRKSTRLNSSH